MEFPPGLQQLSSKDALLAVCLFGLVTHQVFRRFETYCIPLHMALLTLPMTAGFVLLKYTMSPLYAACTSVTVFLSTMLASVAVYRMSPFHPLAQYPGPLACKLTKFWMARIGYTGRQHLYIQSLHERYGDVIRIGPNELSLRDPTVREEALGPHGLPKGPVVIGRTLTATNPPLPGITDQHIHHERRKPWNRAFSATALKEYEPFVAARAKQLAHVLGSQKGDVDLGRFFNFFTYDFMCDMAFGGGSELLRDGDNDGIWSTLEQGWPAATFLSHVPWLAIYVAYLPAASASVARLLEHSKEFTLARIRRGAERKDVFHYLSNGDQPEKGTPPIQQLIDDGVLAIVAGADTTSSALTSLFFCLMRHPETYKQLQAEVDQFYPDGEDPGDAKHHRDMPYLTACIHETLRLYPPAPGGTQRQVPHGSQGATLGSYFIPAGTSLFLHAYSLQRDPRNFSSPAAFRPERWLPSEARERETEPDAVHNEAAFMPFSHGPANCVGRQLAMQEMRTVVCAVMQRLEVRLREGWNVREYEEGFLDFLVTKRPALPVTVCLRQRG